MTDISSLASSPSLYSRRDSRVSHQTHAQVLPSTRGLGVFADSDYESDEEEFDNRARMSMVSGPTVRKYSEVPWTDFDDTATASVSGSHGITRMIQAAKTRSTNKSRQTSPTGSTMTTTSTAPETSARRPINLFGKGVQLFPSTSGASLASNQTSSTITSDHLVTPKLKPPFSGSTSPTQLGDHGHLARDVSEETLLPIAKANSPQRPNTGSIDPSHFTTSRMPTAGSVSPGFGLISLEQAQEREKQKSHKRTGTAHKIVNVLSVKGDSNIPSSPPNRVKNKKSGLMKLFNKDKATGLEPGATLPKLPTPPLNSSLHVVAHPSFPTKSRLPTEESGETISLRSGSGVASIIDSTASSPMLDKPLPTRRASPPKKKKERSKEPPRLLGEELAKPRLELRPVSMNFSNGFASDYLAPYSEGLSSGASSPVKSAGPLTPSEASFGLTPSESSDSDQLGNARKAWRLQQFELEAQIRELRLQLEDARKPKPGGCNICGCACGGKAKESQANGVMDRARVKTGGPRGVFGSGSLYE